MIAIGEIANMVDGRVKIHEPLAKYTSFKIGGPADLVIEPGNRTELVSVTEYLSNHGVPYIILGNGSNVLISDEGFRGAVISMTYGFSGIQQSDDNTITAGAGVRLSKFVDYCITHGYNGYEMLAGIPGTLGGAIVINAGAYGGEISDNLVHVTVVRDNEVLWLDKDDCGFGYRTSQLQDTIILEATFHNNAGNVEAMKQGRKELMMKRKASQPVQYHNAGSIFKNPEGAFAAKLIEEAGLKGKKHGTAEVSEQHSNFIVCKNQGYARDVLALMDEIRAAVYTKYGVKLDLEIRLIGFSDETLEHLRR